MATCTVAYSSGITTNAASYTAVVLGASVGDLIIAIYQSGATTATAGLSDNKSGTYTIVSSVGFNTTAASMAAFVGNQFVTTSSFTLTNTWTGDNADGCTKAIYAVSGMTKTGAAAIKQMIVQNNSASTTMRLVFSGNVSSSNPVIGAIGCIFTTPSISPPSGWTEGTDTGYATPANGMETVFTNSTFNGTTIDWGSSAATVCGALALELDTSLILGGSHLRMMMGVGS